MQKQSMKVYLYSTFHTAIQSYHSGTCSLCAPGFCTKTTERFQQIPMMLHKNTYHEQYSIDNRCMDGLSVCYITMRVFLSQSLFLKTLLKITEVRWYCFTLPELWSLILFSQVHCIVDLLVCLESYFCCMIQLQSNFDWQTA